MIEVALISLIAPFIVLVNSNDFLTAIAAYLLALGVNSVIHQVYG